MKASLKQTNKPNLLKSKVLELENEPEHHIRKKDPCTPEQVNAALQTQRIQNKPRWKFL